MIGDFVTTHERTGAGLRVSSGELVAPELLAAYLSKPGGFLSQVADAHPPGTMVPYIRSALWAVSVDVSFRFPPPAFDRAPLAVSIVLWPTPVSNGVNAYAAVAVEHSGDPVDRARLIFEGIDRCAASLLAVLPLLGPLPQTRPGVLPS